MDLSIVIPTRDRRDRVLATLDALDQQEIGEVAAEVVVVDNGSSDGTLAALRSRSGRLAAVVLSEPRPGASFARNRALEAAGGDVVVLLGDDMVPAAPDLLARHLALHRERPEDGYGVLGRVEWASPVTPFMRWLEEAGLQFSFDRLDAGPVDPAAFLYSSHASFKRRQLLAVGGFDERFPFLMEDTELGIRLRRAGAVLDYRPELLVGHHHPQDPEGFAARMRVVGAAGRRLHSIWPDDAPAEITTPSAKWRLYRPAAAAGRALLRAGARGWLRERAWTALIMDGYARGWAEGDGG